MTANQQFVILYAFFWIVRVQGCLRRGRQPRLRGPEWFFNVRVAPGFHDGPGVRLLRDYWLRMMVPFAIDVPWAIYIFRTGRFPLFGWLIVVLSAVIHVNHLISVGIAERAARRYAAAAGEGEVPVARVAVSLQPRRLRDYANPAREYTIAVVLAVGIALVVWFDLTPAHRNIRLAVGVPLLMLYAQGGLLFVKRIVLEWRRPAPEAQIDAYLEASEQTRRYYLLVCDWYRLAFAASILMWPIRLALPASRGDLVVTIWFAAWMTLGAAATVWVEIKRKQLEQLKIRARPVRLPEYLHPSGAHWPVCYQPSAPTLILRGARGYSLNLADSAAQYGAAYLAGFAAIVTIIRMTL